MGNPLQLIHRLLAKMLTASLSKNNGAMQSVVGMLLYLSGNSRPDVVFVVNQAAQFTHVPKASHAIAVNRIVRYLIEIKDRGLVF